MAADAERERAIHALLDGRSVDPPADGGSRRPSWLLIDAIARAHRIALFGDDVVPESSDVTRWGSLDIRSEVGRGAAAAVYRAWDPRLAREVALKLFIPEARLDGALEEGRLLARLNHPHIVRVFGADAHDGVAGIWMELLDGETLDAILARDGVFSPEEAAIVGVDLAQALSAVHAAGLLHRDVKARNVMRERGGRIVLMDLSAGRIADARPIEGDGAGTPMYMAPEVLAGGHATEQSDLYSLGVLLFRLMTGTFPVATDSLDDLKNAHASGARTSLQANHPRIPSDLAQVVDRCCHPDPEKRFPTASAFEGALSAALRRGLRLRAAAASPLRRWWRWRRHAAMSMAAAVVLGLVATVVVWETGAGRSLRRAAGLAVPPRSPLYLTMAGALGIVRDGKLTVWPYNPAHNMAIAVSADMGVVTMSQRPPWTLGVRFSLAGAPAASPRLSPMDLCCFQDGTTDGAFNYAPRQDSTLLEPIDSRRTAVPALYRFARDWSHPEFLFTLGEGPYFGIAYATATDTFWMSKVLPSGSAIEQWSRDGRLVSSPVTNLPGTPLRGVALDPRDGTLWVLREGSAIIHLENFATDGRYLGAFVLDRPFLDIASLGSSGSEFSFASTP